MNYLPTELLVSSSQLSHCEEGQNVSLETESRSPDLFRLLKHTLSGHSGFLQFIIPKPMIICFITLMQTRLRNFLTDIIVIGFALATTSCGLH
jgi:hypothetical protein